MPSVSACPLCETSSAFELAYHKAGIPIYRCRGCGVGKAEPEQFDAAAYYDSSYFNGGRSDGYSDYVQARDVLHAQFRQDIALLKRLGAGSGHLVELGCAYGYFLDEAKASSYLVSGVELCEDAVKNCNARGLNDVHHGEVSKEALSQFSEADVVVLLDVIEHLPDPVASIEAAASTLKAGGLLLMTTGDFSSVVAKITGSNWRLMTPPQHLWFFTPKSLEALCDRMGLDLVHLDHPWKKVPIGLIAYQLLRYLSLRPSLPGWMHRVGIPVNLFDAMRLVFRKREAA
ncbi:class I SAM-dependent methyltransferase [Achromobacter aegrifaciens]